MESYVNYKLRKISSIYTRISRKLDQMILFDYAISCNQTHKKTHFHMLKCCRVNLLTLCRATKLPSYQVNMLPFAFICICICICFHLHLPSFTLAFAFICIHLLSGSFAFKTKFAFLPTNILSTVYICSYLLSNLLLQVLYQI